MKLKDIHKHGIVAQGKSELIKYLKGKSLTRAEAIKAKCYECNCGYTDGKNDCGIIACPLYGYMPYNPNKDKPKITLTEEPREVKRQQMKRMRTPYKHRETHD